MTHEYVIATGGVIFVADEEEPGPSPTAIAWAADRILAIGSDDVVRGISRGDSTFIDLEGCVVTPLFDAASRLEPGAAADLAFWRDEPGGPPRIVAIVRSGAFTEGDEHRGPFPSAHPG